MHENDHHAQVTAALAQADALRIAGRWEEALALLRHLAPTAALAGTRRWPSAHSPRRAR